jgi:hypothetical protein
MTQCNVLSWTSNSSTACNLNLHGHVSDWFIPDPNGTLTWNPAYTATVSTPITYALNLANQSVAYAAGPVQVVNVQPAPPREFNKYLNASDLLAAFGKYAQEVRRHLTMEEFMELPIHLFVQWLVIEAARFDQTPVPDGVPATVRFLHRCRDCGRFLPREYQRLGANFCSPAHMERALVKGRQLALPAAA